jgi:hypothetical protein
LSKDKDVNLVLVAPTPLFLPPNRPSPGMLKRTIVVADPDNDPFVPASKDKSYFRALANGPHPPGYKPVKNNYEAHFIIGENMGLEFVKSLVEQTSRKPQVITFRNLPPMNVGGKAVAPNVSANSKLKVRLASGNTRVARVDASGRIVPLQAGTTVIRATQPGNSQWMPAFPVERALTVRAKGS